MRFVNNTMKNQVQFDKVASFFELCVRFYDIDSLTNMLNYTDGRIVNNTTY